MDIVCLTTCIRVLIKPKMTISMQLIDFSLIELHIHGIYKNDQCLFSCPEFRKKLLSLTIIISKLL